MLTVKSEENLYGLSKSADYESEKRCTPSVQHAEVSRVFVDVPEFDHARRENQRDNGDQSRMPESSIH